MYDNYAGTVSMNLGCPGQTRRYGHIAPDPQETMQLYNHTAGRRDFLANSFPTGNDIMFSSNSTEYRRTGILLGPSNNNKHKENNLAKILKQKMQNKRKRMKVLSLLQSMAT